MSFPRKLLAPGEEVYLDSRPNWSYLFWPSVLTVVVLAGCVAVFVLWAGRPEFMKWVLLALGASALVYFAARYVAWRTKSFVVTSQRIVYRTGALRRTGREIPIGRVQDVTYHQTVVERIVRAGSLTVESAGRHGQDPFPDISRPAEVQSLINRVVAQAAGGFLAGQSPAAVPAPATAVAAVGAPRVAESAPITDPTPRVPAPPVIEAMPRAAATPTIGQQLGQLAELHQHGVITDAEYEQKRRELLDRL
jgi:membrane protein YdbS with pleckstrin-like domain